jgi:hypothetical protein
MDYDQFDADFTRVYDAAGAGLSTEDLKAEIERLQRVAEGIENAADRERAGHDIAMLEDLVAHDDDPPPSPAMIEAFGAYKAAILDEGTVAERIARAEKGIEEIERIADRADPEEELSIGGMAETLHMLIGSLRPDLQ